MSKPVCGDKACWCITLAISMLVSFGGVALFGLYAFRDCCRADYEVCQALKALCHRSKAGVVCDDPVFDLTCKDKTMRVSIGIVSALAGGIVAGIATCGVCACCCFHSGDKGHKQRFKGMMGLPVGQPYMDNRFQYAPKGKGQGKGKPQQWVPQPPPGGLAAPMPPAQMGFSGMSGQHPPSGYDEFGCNIAVQQQPQSWGGQMPPQPVPQGMALQHPPDSFGCNVGGPQPQVTSWAAAGQAHQEWRQMPPAPVPSGLRE